jgi:GAF domain-containing protein
MLMALSGNALMEKAGLTGYGLHERVNRICAAVVALTHADQSGVGLVDKDILRHIGTSPPNNLLARMSLPVKDSPAYIVINEDRPLVIDSLAHLAIPQAQIWSLFAKSYIGVPVRFEGVPVACLGAYTLHGVHRWTSVEVTVMEGIAKMVEACFPLTDSDVARIRGE